MKKKDKTVLVQVLILEGVNTALAEKVRPEINKELKNVTCSRFDHKEDSRGITIVRSPNGKCTVTFMVTEPCCEQHKTDLYSKCSRLFKVYLPNHELKISTWGFDANK